MRLEPTPRPDHVLRVSARLITSSTILHLSSDELEHALTQEQIENPTLDVRENRVCLLCGTPMYGATCPACGHFAQQMLETPPILRRLPTSQSQSLSGLINRLFLISTITVLPMLMQRTSLISSHKFLSRLRLKRYCSNNSKPLITPDDAPIAEQLVGNLNEHGLLEASIEEIATVLNIPLTRVAYVLSQLQTLEPLGIGARDARECLLIQLQALSEQESPHPLAYALIDNYLDLPEPQSVCRNRPPSACARTRGASG